MTPLVIDGASEVAAAFFAGHCRAYTSDASQLAAVRLRAPGDPQTFEILPERISKEPLGPVVWGGDPEWTTLVRWVLYTLILAEENGATQDNVDAVLAERHGPLSRLAGGEKGQLAQALGVAPNWGLRAVNGRNRGREK